MSRRITLEGATEPKRLGRGARTDIDWKQAVDGRAPRLGTREYIAGGITRRGRFEDKDPLATPKLWSRWRWLGLLGWVGLLGGAGWKAWRDHGGLPGR